MLKKLGETDSIVCQMFFLAALEGGLMWIK